MSIPSEVVQEFSRKVRDRGQIYFVGGKVRIVDAGDGVIEARVRGSQTYTVYIDTNYDPWDFECDCPFADSWGGICKHAWATLLKADKDGLLPNGMNGAGEDDEVLLTEDGIDVYPSSLPHRKKTPEPSKEPQWKRT